ncbi:30S ribosomal protein S20 [candidate division GN15 bacterium]|nr:30S ribosomal protein S20 [candidate division GN15 bacterium]
MPNHKSCEKRMRTSEKQRVRNRAFRSQLRAAIKDVRSESNKEEAAKKLESAKQILDKAASKGLIHPRNADRNKSRLAMYVNKLS